jgi:hypothetical protein
VAFQSHLTPVANDTDHWVSTYLISMSRSIFVTSVLFVPPTMDIPLFASAWYSGARDTTTMIDRCVDHENKRSEIVLEYALLHISVYYDVFSVAVHNIDCREMPTLT